MMQALAMRAHKQYAVHVLEKKGTEFDSSNNESALTAQCRFFTCVYPRLPSMGSDGRDTFGYAGVLSCRSVNPTICCPPRLTAGERLNRNEGGHHA